MNLRNVALLVLLVELSFQSEIVALSAAEEKSQFEESKNIENNNYSDNNGTSTIFNSLIVISNYIK